MSYVSVDAPLPRNSLSPVPPCEAAKAAAIVNSVEQSVANARAASLMIATPASFAGMGQGVVNDVTRGQAERQAAGVLSLHPATHVKDYHYPTPKVVPLSVTEEEFNGCSIRGTDGLMPMPVALDKQRVLMPQSAPVDTGLLITGNSFPSTQSLGRIVLPPGPKQLYTAGYPGFKGMGIAWGDSRGSVSRNGNGSAQGRWKALGILALVGVGLYAMGKKGR